MPHQPAAYDYLEAVPSAILLVRDERILWANSAAVALTGYERGALSGMAFGALVASDAGAVGRQEGAVEIVNAHGAAVPVQLSARAIELDDQPAEVVTLLPLPPPPGSSPPVSSDVVYRQAIESSPDAFFLLQAVRDSDGNINDFVITDVNSRGEQLLNRNRAVIVGRSVLLPIAPEYRRSLFDLYLRVAISGEVVDEEFQAGESWYHHQLIPFGDRIAVFTREITGRKQTETALHEIERRYQALLTQSNDCVSLMDMDAHYLYVNQQFVARLGYSAEEMIGRHVSEIVVPDEFQDYQRVHNNLRAGEEIPLIVRTYRRKDGGEFLGEVNLSLVRDDNGTPVYILSIMRDITWRKEAEQALRESEERYRIISELISDYAYAFRIDPDGTPISEWITDSFMRMTGYTPDEIDAKGQFALYYPGEETRVAADMARVLKGEAGSGEYRIVTKSGETRWVNIYRKPVWDDEHKRIIRLIGVAQDITKRKESEGELRRSEEQYRHLAENASDMISRVTDDDTRIYVSSASRTLLGYEPEELLGPNSSSIIHPDDAKAVAQTWSVLRETRQQVTFTCRLRHKNGSYRWFEVTCKAVLDSETGGIKEYIALSRDISSRMEMEAILKEQERLRYELQSEQKLNEIKSNLMRTISHEFRTPLALIQTSTDFLDNYIDRLDAQKRKDRLQSIRVQIKRLSDMLDDISFVVQGTLHHMTAHPSQMHLEDYIRSIVGEIETTIGRNHRFNFETDGTLVQGIADKALVLRILTNLLSNAIKYSPEDSVITVALYRDGSSAVLEVSDQGIGISAEEQKRIFEPFYRGASVIDTVGGTGLGLSIVKDCVSLHDGTISVQSAQNQGTTFSIRLPQTDA